MALADLLIKVGANVEEYMSAMDAVVSKAADSMEKVEDRFSSLSNVGEALAKVGAGLTAAVTLPIVGIGGAALKAAADMEQAKIGFTTLLRSGDAATEMLAKLRDFAAKTPFNFPELVTGAQRLLAMGTTAQDLIPKMTAIGNATAAMGKGIETFDGIALALSQMGNSAKATAQDMNQLIQRGIDPYKFLAESSGKSIGEIRKNLGELFTGAEASQIILAGMTKQFAGAMDAQSKSFSGMWSNVQDSIKFTLADIGSTLLPTAKIIVDKFVVPTLEGLKSLAHWFAELPEPIKMGALALGGLAAAIGPLLLVVGGLGMALPAITVGLTAIAGVTGLAVAPFLAIAGAVGAAVVALTVLGVWVSQNWEPIKATVMQAWSGITELWTAIWTPVANFLQGIWSGIGSVASTVWGGIATFFTTIWTPIAPYFVAAWNGIGSVLSSIWNGIKSVAETVWNAVIGAIDGFLKWAAKIPGVNKLFNLDEAWSNAAKLAEQTKKSTAEVKANADAHKTATPVIAKHTAEIDKHGKSVATTTEHVRKFTAQQQQHAIRLYETTEAMKKANAEMDELNALILKGEGPLEEWTHILDKVGVQVDRMTPDMKAFAGVIGEVNTQAARSADALGVAFENAGIKSTRSMKETADNLRVSYDYIRDSGVATKGEIEQAWRAMTQAELDYRRNLGEDVSKLEAELAKYDNAHKNLQKKTLDTWDEIRRGINASVDDFGRNLSNLGRDLLSGDFSLSKLSDAFKQLGLDIAQTFLDVGAKAITNFIKEHIGALLNALGSVLEKIPAVGNALGGIFTGAGGVLGTTVGASGGAAATIGQAGQTAGSAGSAAGGALNAALGWAGLGVSVVSGIVSGFQQSKMNDTLKLIEESTRYSKAFLYGLVVQALDFWPQIANIRDFLWTVGHDAWAEMITEIQHSNDWLRGITDIAGDLRLITLNIRDYATATFEIIRDEIVTRLAGLGERVGEVVLPSGGGALSVDSAAIAGVLEDAIAKLGVTLTQARIQPANITLTPVIDATGQLSTMNSTLAGISMMMARGLGLTAPKGGEFEFISPTVVSAIARAETAVVSAVTRASAYLADIAANLAPQSGMVAVGNGITVNIDLRGAVGMNRDVIDTIGREVTNRIRSVAR